MNRSLQVLAGLMSGALVFIAASQYLHLQTWFSLVLASLTAIVTFVSAALDFFKKPLEVWKLKLEVSKLRREADEDQTSKEDEERLIQPATPDEVERYGASYTERRIRAVIRVQGEKDLLNARSFISKTSEKRTNP